VAATDLYHGQSAITEVSTPTCNSSIAELYSNLRANVELSSGNSKNALVLDSSPSPLKRREKRISKNAEREMPESG
jgi:hypothetical protein